MTTSKKVSILVNEQNLFGIENCEVKLPNSDLDRMNLTKEQIESSEHPCKQLSEGSEPE